MDSASKKGAFLETADQFKSKVVSQSLVTSFHLKFHVSTRAPLHNQYSNTNKYHQMHQVLWSGQQHLLYWMMGRLQPSFDSPCTHFIV